MIFSADLFQSLHVKKQWHLADSLIAATYGYVVPLLETSIARFSIDVDNVRRDLSSKVRLILDSLYIFSVSNCSLSVD